MNFFSAFPWNILRYGRNREFIRIYVTILSTRFSFLMKHDHCARHPANRHQGDKISLGKNGAKCGLADFCQNDCVFLIMEQCSHKIGLLLLLKNTSPHSKKFAQSGHPDRHTHLPLDARPAPRPPEPTVPWGTPCRLAGRRRSPHRAVAIAQVDCFSSLCHPSSSSSYYYCMDRRRPRVAADPTECLSP
jgi:hypothetical protein